MSTLSCKWTVWCNCDPEHTIGPQYAILEDKDWHGEIVKMKCPRCGHTVTVERGFVSDKQVV